MSMSAMGWLQSTIGLDITGEWNQVIHINVGGQPFSCLRKTLQPCPPASLLGQLATDSGRKDEDGRFIVDRDPRTFVHVLNYLRTAALVLPDSFDDWDLLIADARHFQLKELEDAILSNRLYQRRQVLRALPTTVFLRWTAAKVDIAPALPILTVHENVVYSNQKAVTSVEEAVTILLQYGFHIEHWHRQQEAGKDAHSVFLTLSTI
jgi:hypothetical protein